VVGRSDCQTGPAAGYPAGSCRVRRGPALRARADDPRMHGALAELAGAPRGPSARHPAPGPGRRHGWGTGPEMFTVGSMIDLCHAASMLGLAAVDKSLRRAELADALVAAALAVAEAASAGPFPASDG
jgi:hypothetical protein